MKHLILLISLVLWCVTTQAQDRVPVRTQLLKFTEEGARECSSAKLKDASPEDKYLCECYPDAAARMEFAISKGERNKLVSEKEFYDQYIIPAVTPCIRSVMSQGVADQCLADSATNKALNQEVCLCMRNTVNVLSDQEVREVALEGTQDAANKAKQTGKPETPPHPALLKLQLAMGSCLAPPQP